MQDEHWHWMCYHNMIALVMFGSAVPGSLFRLLSAALSTLDFLKWICWYDLTVCLTTKNRNSKTFFVHLGIALPSSSLNRKNICNMAACVDLLALTCHQMRESIFKVLAYEMETILRSEDTVTSQSFILLNRDKDARVEVRTTWKKAVFF